MEYHGKFEHTIGRIQHIYIMISISIFYTVCYLGNQNVAPTLPCFQGLKWCIHYLDIHPLKPIFYSYNYYYGSNFIRLTWSGNQVEDYTTPNGLVCHQDMNHPIINNIRWYVSGIIHTIIGFLVGWELHIKKMQPLNILLYE